MAIYLGDTLLTGPSGGTAASLTADQTFTGVNTFSDTTVGIQTEKITGTTDMSINANGTEILGFYDISR